MKSNIAVAIGGGVQRKGETLAIDRAILRMTKKQKPLVVFIPTASFDRPDYIDSFESYFQKLGARVHSLKLETRRPGVADDVALASADIFYFGGGDARHLNRKLSNSYVLQKITRRYKAGAIIAGTSAGASILFPKYLAINKEGRAEYGTGLNILGLKSEIFLHFNPSTYLSKVRISKSTIAIPNSGAVVFINSKPLDTLGAKAFTFQYNHGKYELRSLF